MKDYGYTTKRQLAEKFLEIKKRKEKEKMSIFKKKPIIDDLIAAIQELNDEDKSKLAAVLLTDSEVDEKVTQNDEQQTTDEVNENTPDSEVTDDTTEEAIAELEENSEPEDVSENDEAPNDEPGKPEVRDAMAARIASVEERIENLSKMLDDILSRLDNKPFGNGRQAPPAGDLTDDDEGPVMRSYNRKQTNFRQY